MHSVLSTVEAGEGVALVSASARNLRADNVAFFRLQPTTVRIDFVAAWRKKEPSIALKSFLQLLDEENAGDSTEDAFPLIYAIR